MKKTLLAAFLGVLTLSLTNPSMVCAADPAAGTEAAGASASVDGISSELKRLREGLAVKQAELTKLRRKWMASKGRIPTEKELKEFEKKRAKGPTKPEDNPYVNKNPLSSPARWREAYFELLAEMKNDQETIARLQRELDSLKH